jgi:hypothetical protein
LMADGKRSLLSLEANGAQVMGTLQCGARCS